MSRAQLFDERLLEGFWLAALAIVPLYFNVYSSRVFEPDKTIFFRCLVALMLVTQTAEYLRQRGSLGPSVNPAPFSVGSIRKRLASVNPLFWPVAFVIATESIATLTSIVPWTSFYGSYQRMQGTLTLFAYISFFWIISSHLRSIAQLRRIMIVLLVTSLPISLYGIAQHLQIDPLPWGGDVTFRVTSTMGNAIFLAAYLTMIVPLTVAGLLAAVTRYRRTALPGSGRDATTLGQRAIMIAAFVIGLSFALVVHTVVPTVWWLIPVFITVSALVVASMPVGESSRAALVEAIALGLLGIVQIACIAFTQSRGPWLGLLVGAVVFVVLRQLRGPVNRRRLAATIALIGLMSLVLVAFNLAASPLAHFRTVPYLGRLGQLTDVSDGTGRVRVLIWQGTSVLLTQHPSIGLMPDPLNRLRRFIGYGPESMRIAYNAVYPPELGDLEARNAAPDRNHNDLLDHLVTSGIIGLLAYLTLVGASLHLAASIFRRSIRLEDATLVIGLVAALVAHLTETQTGIAIVSTRTMFWTILAVLAAITTRSETFFDHDSAPDEPMEVSQSNGPNPDAVRRKVYRRSAQTSPVIVPHVPDFIPAHRRQLIWLSYAVVVMGTYAVATAAYSAGLLSVQVWVYLAFGWVVLAILTYALSESSVIPQEARGRSVLVGGLAALIVATLAIGFDLNHIAADVYHKQGTGLDGDQRFAESVHSFAQALALAPDQDYYALYLGRSLLDVAMRAPIQRRTFDRTLSLPEILQADPAAVAQYSRADAFSAAEVSLQRARELAPLDPDHVANLARLYRYWGQSTDPTKFQLALQFSAIATQLSPHSVQLFSEWAVLLLAQDDLVDAFQKASVAVQLDPRYAASHLVLGDIYLARKDPDAAIAEHSLALGLDPTSLADGDFDRRVSKYVELGRGALLVEAYQRLLARDSSRTIRLAYAYVLSKTDHLPLAIEQYEVLVQGDPADWLSQRNLAVAYSQSGNQTRARAAANAALRVAPPSQQPSIESIISALGPG